MQNKITAMQRLNIYMLNIYMLNIYKIPTLTGHIVRFYLKNKRNTKINNYLNVYYNKRNIRA